MASSASLEEKFNAAVKAIQRLPNDGKKLFYSCFVFFKANNHLRNISTIK